MFKDGGVYMFGNTQQYNRNEKSLYTANLVIIISKKSGSAGPIINTHLKMQMINDSSGFYI